jgi:hypothetical protein
MSDDYDDDRSFDDGGDDGSESYALDPEGTEQISQEDLEAWANETVEDRFARGELQAQTLVDPSADAWAEQVIHGEEHYADSHHLWQAGDPVTGAFEPHDFSEAVHGVFEGVTDFFSEMFSGSDD